MVLVTVVATSRPDRGVDDLRAARKEVRMAETGVPEVPETPWSDPRYVVEGLESASCGAHAKTLAIEGIAVAEQGGTEDDWRTLVQERHHTHPRWKEHLDEAERCMRLAGIWPWGADPERS